MFMINLLRTLLLFLSIFLLIPLSALSQELPEFVKGQLYVKVKNTAAADITYPVKESNLPDEWSELVVRYTITSIKCPFILEDENLQKTYLLTFRKLEETDQLMYDISQFDHIEYVEKVPLHKHFHTPDDLDSKQWHLAKVDAENAWNINTGSANIVVAMVDDAVLLSHQDLAANIWVNPGEIPGNGIDDDGNGYTDDINGWDAADNDNDPNPPGSANTNYFSHGTHCAGITAATTNNSTGIASLGYNIKIMAVKTQVSASSGGGLQGTLGGVQYAIAAGADIISMSWGSVTYSQTYQNLFNTAHSRGIVLVAAAGNSNTSMPSYPAGYNHVISVGASDVNDVRASFSNYGNTIDVMAPGKDIWSTVPGNNYAYKSGTSMACPLVSGLCGLMLSKDPLLTPDSLENCLKSSCDNIDAQNPAYIGKMGAGRINAYEALRCIKNVRASFDADKYSICPGQSVTFSDESNPSPTSWKWTFAGGSPTTSTAQNPVVTYNTAGSYDVTLIISTAQGNDTITKPAYIKVSTPTATISGNATITKGSNANLRVDLTGSPPWNISYSDGTGSHNITGITNSPYYITVFPEDTTTYTLVSVGDARCSAATSGAATIQVDSVINGTKCIVIKPGPSTSKDLLIMQANPTSRNNTSCFIQANAWTAGGPLLNRTLIEFDLSTIPSSASVSSATLSLYSVASRGCLTTEDHSGDNESVIQRITSSWNQSTVSWNNSPSVTVQNQVFLQKSDSATQDYDSIDVTAMIEDMLANPSSSFGFMMKLQTEIRYRRLSFLSSDHSDPNYWPKLTICIAEEPKCSGLTADFEANKVCRGDSTSFIDASTDTNSTANRTVVRRWYFGDGDSAVGIAYPKHIYATADTFSATLIVGNDLVPSCFDTITQPVIVVDTLAISLNSSDSICVGDSLINNAAVLCGSPPYSYSWTPTQGVSNPAILNPKISPSSSRNYFLTVTDGNNWVCTDSIQIDVVNTCCKSHAAIFLTDSILCTGDTTEFQSISVAQSPATYRWSFGSGSKPNQFTGVSPPPVNYKDDGLIQVSLILDDPCGSDTAYQNLYVFPLPIANAGNDTAICDKDTIGLGTSPIVDYLYNWTPTPNIGQPDIANPETFIDSNTIHHLEVTDIVSGCTNRDSMIITVEAMPDSFSLGSDTSICKGTTLVLGNAIPQSGTNYLWQDSSISSSLQVDTNGIFWLEVANRCGIIRDSISVSFMEKIPVDLGSDTSFCFDSSLTLAFSAPSASVLWNDHSTDTFLVVSQHGKYWVDVTNQCGTTTDTVFLQRDSLLEKPLAESAILCTGDSIVLDVGIQGADYFWSTGQDSAQITVKAGGTYWVKIRNACEEIIDSINVSTLSKPATDLGDNTSICNGDNLLLNAEWQSANYSWSDGSSVSDFLVTQPGLYWVNVQNICGSDRDTIEISPCPSDEKIWIPNAFSPNSNGINDYLKLYATPGIKNITFSVYNRWGELLFKAEGTDIRWNGMHQGLPCPQGAYLFTCSYEIQAFDYPVQRFIEKGMVYLLR